MSGRVRRTRAEIEAFDTSVALIAERVRPATCRQVYYRAVVAELVDKDARGYRLVCESLARQRWAGSLPWEWIVDETRAQRAPQSWADANRGMASFAEAYRRDVWRSQPVAVEVWCESDSLAGTLVSVTWKLGVPLFSGRGFASITSLRGAAEQIARRDGDGQGSAILYVGDLDPSGWEASRAAERGLARHLDDHGSDALPMFRRVAVNPSDVGIYGLPTGCRPKSKGPGSTSWWADGGPGLDYTVEAEAFEPEKLRQIVRKSVLGLADVDALQRAWRVEMLERETLIVMAKDLPNKLDIEVPS